MWLGYYYLPGSTSFLAPEERKYSIGHLRISLSQFSMTIKAAKFEPKVLLEAPRRSGGSPNSDASKVLYSVTTYVFSEHAKKSEIRILDTKSQQTSLVTDDKTASEANWLDDDRIVLLKSNEDGTTSVVVGGADDFETRFVALLRQYPMTDAAIVCIVLVALMGL